MSLRVEPYNNQVPRESGTRGLLFLAGGDVGPDGRAAKAAAGGEGGDAVQADMAQWRTCLLDGVHAEVGDA